MTDLSSTDLVTATRATRAAKPSPITITDAAAARVKNLLSLREGSAAPIIGIKIDIKTKGCSGLSYAVDYAEKAGQFDEVVEEKGVKILIDPRAMMFLLGTEMDYQEDKFTSGFVFRNPNEKGRCGCGESFHT